jgi:hypothetical protein
VSDLEFTHVKNTSVYCLPPAVGTSSFHHWVPVGKVREVYGPTLVVQVVCDRCWVVAEHTVEPAKPMGT